MREKKKKPDVIEKEQQARKTWKAYGEPWNAGTTIVAKYVAVCSKFIIIPFFDLLFLEQGGGGGVEGS